MRWLRSPELPLPNEEGVAAQASRGSWYLVRDPLGIVQLWQKSFVSFNFSCCLHIVPDCEHRHGTLLRFTLCPHRWVSNLPPMHRVSAPVGVVIVRLPRQRLVAEWRSRLAVPKTKKGPSQYPKTHMSYPSPYYFWFGSNTFPSVTFNMVSALGECLFVFSHRLAESRLSLVRVR